MKALLIIDMQLGCFQPYSLKYKTLDVISNINTLSSKFRKLNYLVIHIAHNGTKENYLFPGTPDFNFLPELSRCSTDKYIVKEANDAFYKTELGDILTKYKITDLYITGQATNFCLDATVKVALHKDFKIIIPSDAHTTSETKNIKAEVLINYYNWLWSNLTPMEKTIEVETTVQILEKLDSTFY